MHRFDWLCTEHASWTVSVGIDSSTCLILKTVGEINLTSEKYLYKTQFCLKSTAATNVLNESRFSVDMYRKHTKPTTAQPLRLFNFRRGPLKNVRDVNKILFC